MKTRVKKLQETRSNINIVNGGQTFIDCHMRRIICIFK